MADQDKSDVDFLPGVARPDIPLVRDGEDALVVLRAIYDGATPGPYVQCGADRGGCECGWVFSRGHDCTPLKAPRRDEDAFEFTAEQQFANGRCAAVLHNVAPELFALIEAADLFADLTMRHPLDAEQVTALERYWHLRSRLGKEPLDV